MPKNFADPNFAGKVVNNDDVPVTLEPKLVRDRFAIQRDAVSLNRDADCALELKPIFLQATANLEPTSVVKTEYSTFTYFVTSLIGGSTVTKTDIIVSSNVVTEAQYPEPTPTFEVG